MLVSQLIRYHSAPSLYLLLVCANTGTRMLLFLPLWGISSPRNPERNWQDTRSRTTFRQYTHYSAQQMCTAVSTCQQLRFVQVIDIAVAEHESGRLAS